MNRRLIFVTDVKFPKSGALSNYMEQIIHIVNMAFPDLPIYIVSPSNNMGIEGIKNLNTLFCKPTEERYPKVFGYSFFMYSYGMIRLTTFLSTPAFLSYLIIWGMDSLLYRLSSIFRSIAFLVSSSLPVVAQMTYHITISLSINSGWLRHTIP